MCPVCRSRLEFSYWNDRSCQPRVIQDVDNVALLVSAVYVCEQRHKVLGHDEAVLSVFPSCSIIPFIVLSPTGFTHDLMNLCIRLVVHGVNFYTIESIITERHWESYLTKLQALNCHEAIRIKSITESDFWSSSFSKRPSNNIISKIFMAKNNSIYMKYQQFQPLLRLALIIHFE